MNGSRRRPSPASWTGGGFVILGFVDRLDGDFVGRISDLDPVTADRDGLLVSRTEWRHWLPFRGRTSGWRGHADGDRQLHQNLGATMVNVHHDQVEATRLADRHLVLKYG